MYKKKLIPVCGWCKKIKPEGMDWQTIENYLISQGFTDITHGMCPACSEKIFQKRVYLESYQNIAKIINSSLSLNEVLNLIVTNVVKVMNVKGCLLRLVNKKKGTLDVAAYHGLSEQYINKGTVYIDRSVDDALSGKAVSVYDITEDMAYRYRREASKEGIRSIVSIPMRFEGEVIGILRMYTDEPRDYTTEDLKFVTAIAEQAALAIMNAKYFETIVSREREYLRLFRDISMAISSSLNTVNVLNIIVQKLAESMQVKGATIRLLDEQSGSFKFGAAFGVSDKYLSMKGIDEINHDWFTKKTYTPIAIYDIATDERLTHKDELINESIKSLLIVPIIAKDKAIGVITLLSGWFRSFKQEELELLLSISAQCAIAIENAIMYEKKYKEATYLKILQNITKLLSAAPDFSEILDIIVTKLPEIMNTKAATIRLIDKETNKLVLVASNGLSPGYLKRGSIDTEDNIQMALTGKPVAIYDAAQDSRIIYNKEAEAEGIKSILAVPLIVYGEIIGVLRLLTDSPRYFVQDEIDFAMALAEEAAIAIKIKKFIGS
ncbi:MAG: GAF domain-containing protein [Candidatus Magnetoovum sp. WYHC-5]|nr:GAF domain-containing protein [Candidatus Magnetoovum sp. WYHC-5]